MSTAIKMQNSYFMDADLMAASHIDKNDMIKSAILKTAYDLHDYVEKRVKEINCDLRIDVVCTISDWEK